MSYNSSPQWTKNISLPSIADFPCPYCGKVSKDNALEVIAVLKYNTYYAARHIPSELIFTCMNPECPHCDDDYVYTLSLEVKTELK